eukprot:sb/3477762/
MVTMVTDHNGNHGNIPQHGSDVLPLSLDPVEFSGRYPFYSSVSCCMTGTWEWEFSDTSKQPIRTRYLGHVTGYHPIRDQHFRSVPNYYHEDLYPILFIIVVVAHGH